MTQDDLSSWLKASAENRITPKNAWQATLIEHFVDTDKFAARGGVNFQRASSTLEGCMKVYSTRVDDVSESTLKLLEMFNKEEEGKKKPTNKKKGDFIEKNPANINLKEKEASDFYDPLFSSILLKSTEYFLMEVLEPTSGGAMLYGHQARNIVMEDEKIEIDVRQLPICYSLKDFEAAIDQRAEEPVDDDYTAQPDFGAYSDENFEDPGDHNGEMTAESGAPATVQQTEVLSVFSETPFGYFKGWAGPAHWKAQLGKKRETEKKPRQRFFLDFTAKVDQAVLETKSETVLTKQAILERRKNKNFLPEDYSYEIKDLYKLLKAEGYFGIHREPVNEEVVEPAPVEDTEPMEIDFDMGLDSLVLNDKITNTFVSDAPPAETEIQLKFTRTPKRVNIKKLKENVSALLAQKCDRFSQIVSLLPNSYTPKEAKDISPHFCLISLLHLANEMEFDIKVAGNDLVISSATERV